LEKQTRFTGINPISTYSVNLDDGNNHTMDLYELDSRTILLFNKSMSVCYISLSQKELDSVINFLNVYNGENNGN